MHLLAVPHASPRPHHVLIAGQQGSVLVFGQLAPWAKSNLAPLPVILSNYLCVPGGSEASEGSSCDLLEEGAVGVSTARLC